MIRDPESLEPDELYRTVMARIKPRIDTVHTLLLGSRPLPLRQAVESASLQLRLVLEEIALSSLVANRSAYAKERVRFERDWNAAKMLARLERLNPNFYPVPYKGRTRDERGVFVLLPVEDDFLERSDFNRTYGRLGELCHAPNPYAASPDYEAIAAELMHIRALIMRLLNAHKVHLIGESEMWIVHMVAPNDPTKVYSVRLKNVGRVEDLDALPWLEPQDTARADPGT